MKPRSPLSPDERERVKVLAASGKSTHAVAKILDRSPHTVKKFLRQPETARQVGVARETLAGMFDDVAHRTLAGVSDEDVKKASLLQKMTSAGIAIDKAAMLRDELPPTINVQILLDMAEMIRHKDRAAPRQLPPHEQILEGV
jgi:hypothetical protein